MTTVALQDLSTVDAAVVRSMVNLIGNVDGQKWRVGDASQFDADEAVVTIISEAAANDSQQSNVAVLGRDGASRYLRFAGHRFELRAAPFAEFLERVAGMKGAVATPLRAASTPLTAAVGLTQQLQRALSSKAHKGAVLEFSSLLGDANVQLVVWPSERHFTVVGSLDDLLKVAHRNFWQTERAAEGYSMPAGAAMPGWPLARLLWSLYLAAGKGRLLPQIAIASGYRLARWPDLSQAPNRLMLSRLATRLSAGALPLRELAVAVGVKEAEAANFINAAWLGGYLELDISNTSRPQAAARTEASEPKRSLLGRIRLRLGL
jgi:hypothetical protein